MTKTLRGEMIKILKKHALENAVSHYDSCADAILAKIGEMVPKEKDSEHEEEDCGFCIALEEQVLCETHDEGWNSYYTELQNLLKGEE